MDYGCGLAHFYEHLIANWPYEFEYIGIDINKEFLEYSSTKHKEATFLERDEFLLSNNKFDFVVCIGTFNLKYKQDNFENQQFVFQEIQDIWEKTQDKLYINFMSTVVDYQQENSYHQDVGDIYKFFCSQLTRNVCIDSTYLPYEFSIVGQR
jgi:ubiquinone/menaquinone biosynthesis C-methylase UbiE